jgi:DNA-binding PadR family transcriptional regulator
MEDIMFNRYHQGFGVRGERIFHKGDFKYLILDLLKDKPRHGYEIIRDLGYVTSLAQDAKKIYTITEEGKKFLIEKEKETDEIKANMRSWWGGWSSEFKDEMRDVMRSVGDMGRMIAQQARKAGAEKIPQVKEALKNATAEIERIFKS